MEQVDAIIIGSGQGAKPLAIHLAGQGKEVVVFERDSWGGSCTNYGCTPSKAFLASAHAAGSAKYADDLGVHLQVSVDFPAVMKRIRQMTDSWSQGVYDSLKNAGVHTIHAEASLMGTRTVLGGELEVQAPLVVINTGKSPRVPKIPGLSETPYKTYESFWGLEELPPRSIILGAGYTGMELGQGLARLGSQTHIVDIAGRPIAQEEDDVSKIIGKALYEDGVEFRLNAETERVEFKDGVFRVALKGDEILEGELLLMATGRKPNTEALNAPASGIELDEEGHIRVDEHLRTTCEGVYAIGDVTGQPAFTHVSYEDYRRIRDIMHGHDRKQGDRVLAYAFFTDPQVGRAGLTLEQAKEAGYDARSVTMDLKSVGRASEVGQTEGFYRMIVDKATDKILGATLVSPAAAELIHVFVAHMEAGSTWPTLAQSVHVHPTFAEGLTSLANKLE